jgi:microsomal epoxide hydrolase
MFQSIFSMLILALDPYHAFYSISTPFPDSDKPTGVSWFPHEVFPAIKHTIEKECNLVFYKEHDKGGHFAALECPKEFWEDVEEFATRVWSTTTDEW